MLLGWYLRREAVTHTKMNVRLVAVDPKQGAAAAVIYNYGEERFLDGVLTGAIYSGLGLIFLLSLRELWRQR
jgi:hypothetical protein